VDVFVTKEWSTPGFLKAIRRRFYVPISWLRSATPS
jgi:hypothetical protein